MPTHVKHVVQFDPTVKDPLDCAQISLPTIHSSLHSVHLILYSPRYLGDFVVKLCVFGTFPLASK